MPSNYTPTELGKVYAAFESVLKDLNLDYLHLKSFTLVEPTGLNKLSSVSISEAKDQSSEPWKTILATSKRGRKCYERQCEYKNGKLICKDVQVSCKD